MSCVRPTMRDKNKSPASRDGFALLFVMVFNVIFLALLAISWRQIDSLLQLQSARVDTRARDRDTVPALAWAIRMLENATPTNSEYKLKLKSTSLVNNRSYIDNPEDSAAEWKYFKIKYESESGGYKITVTPLSESEYNILGFELTNEYEFPSS